MNTPMELVARMEALADIVEGRQKPKGFRNTKLKKKKTPYEKKLMKAAKKVKITKDPRGRTKMSRKLKKEVSRSLYDYRISMSRRGKRKLIKTQGATGRKIVKFHTKMSKAFAAFEKEFKAEWNKRQEGAGRGKGKQKAAALDTNNAWIDSLVEAAMETVEVDVIDDDDDYDDDYGDDDEEDEEDDDFDKDDYEDDDE